MACRPILQPRQVLVTNQDLVGHKHLVPWVAQVPWCRRTTCRNSVYRPRHHQRSLVVSPAAKLCSQPVLARTAFMGVFLSTSETTYSTRMIGSTMRLHSSALLSGITTSGAFLEAQSKKKRRSFIFLTKALGSDFRLLRSATSLRKQREQVPRRQWLLT